MKSRGIVSNLWWLAKVLTALVNAVTDLGKKLGLTEEQVDEKVHLLSTSDGVIVINQWAEITIGKSVSAPADWWDKFLEMMISACAFVSYRNQDINGQNFPYQNGDLEPKHVETLSIKQKLRELGRQTMSTREVKDYIDFRGYRSATLVELLWWWLKNPTEHANCLVFALGSVWRGLVPCVHGRGVYRELSLRSTEDGWDEVCSFAVVRKPATPVGK